MKNEKPLGLFMLKAIFEGLEDAVISHNLDDRITLWNPAAEQVFGYGSDEILGKSIHVLIPEEQSGEHSTVFKKVLAGEKIVQLQTTWLKKGNKTIPVTLTVFPIKDNRGRVISIAHIVHNISQEKFAEEGQGMLAAIIENSDDAIISETLDGAIASWNKGAETIFGYTAEEMIGKHISILIAPDRIREEDLILSYIKKSGKVQHSQTVRLSKSGTEIPISLSVSPIKDQMGNIIGISKIARNIRIQKIAEEKQAMLAAIVESSDDAIISKTLEGIIITWNKGAEKIFGYTESEARGKHISILIPQDRMAEETAILQHISQGLKVDHFQTIRLHKNGTEIDISLTVSPIKDSGGVIIGASKVARDITSEIKAREAIRQNTVKLEILNSIGKAISEKLDVKAILQKITDATTQITGAAFGAFFYNTTRQEGESYLLYALSGISRESFERFAVPRNTAIFNTTLRGGGVVRIDDITKDPRFERSVPHDGLPEGNLSLVSYLAVPVISTSREVMGGLFFGHPMTGVFTAEHEDLVANLASQTAIALDNSKLFEAVKELSYKKDEFIALASHELKTPLTSMSGFLQILQKRVGEDPNKLFIQKTLGQLKKLNTLINDLFDISKIQSGKLQLHLEQFDLAIFVKEIIDTYSESISSHKIQFEVKKGFMVNADKLRLEQVVTNLLINAAKYSPESDKIEIWMENSGKEITVFIKDYGLGISKEHFPVIFGQFYRAAEISRNISGLGLGLFITKEIVERHGGRIWVESEPEKGSVFIFTLPFAAGK